jgi:hypothetical protein
MLQTVSRLLPELPLILMTAVATHLVMSFAQTLMHYKLGHHPMGGKFFRARYGVLVVGEEMKGLVNCNFLLFDLKSEATTFSKKDISATIRAEVM